MKIQEQIQTKFNGKAFDRPLFYCYEDGLRFELSEGGHYINQFLTAHRKGLEICQYLFKNKDSICICIKIFGGKTLISVLDTIKNLKLTGIFPAVSKEYWTEFDDEWEGDEDYENNLYHYLAFEIPKSSLSNALWCSFASDFGYIEPHPSVTLYLFDFENEVMVFPYDDRGMDIVGENNAILSDLYSVFNHYLLDYDRELMDNTFK